MTVKEAIHAVRVLSYDDVRRAMRRGNTESTVRWMARVRVLEPDAWSEILHYACGGPVAGKPVPYPGLTGRRRATYAEVKARAAAEAGS